MNISKPMLTVAEAASHLGVNVDDVRDLIETDAFPAFGKEKHLVRAADIIQFVNPHSNITFQHFHDSAMPALPTVPNAIRFLNSNISFKEYFEQYLEGLKGGGISGEGISSRTLSGYQNHANHILPSLGHMSMAQIDKPVIQCFLNSLTLKTYEKGGKEQPLSQSYINKIYDLLHGFIRYAADENNNNRCLATNFMVDMKKPRSNKLKAIEPQALSDIEIQRISNIVSKDQMINVWIHILLYTGVRPSEALALRFEDVDYENKTISIIRALSFKIEIRSGKKKRIPIIKDLKNMNRGKGVNYQRRVLRVSNTLLMHLKEWEEYVKGNSSLLNLKSRNGTSHLLFCGRKGQLWFYDDYKQVYERLLERIGLIPEEFNPYRYRHNYCTRALRMGKDIKTVQLMMGDNTPDMVLRTYANMNKDDILKGSAEYSSHMDQILVGDLAKIPDG